jgi:AcrR family transcriptional regulator
VPRVKQRTPELRDHVLSVAVATLAAGGVTGFTARRVAERAHTSTPAVYELFGDKAGLVREVFFEGFRLLQRHFSELPESADPRADLVDVIAARRAFARANPVLAEVMFSRPFADFDPGPADRIAGSAVREFIVGRVRRCIDAGVLRGSTTATDTDTAADPDADTAVDPATDIAHVLVALAQGLSAQEAAGWLGTSAHSRDRRWALAIEAVLTGLA